MTARSVTAAWILLLCMAPPLSPWFWGANALRSIPLAQALCLVCAAVGAGALAWLAQKRVTERTASLVWATATAVACLLVCVVLRERAHVLGDTWVRARTLANYPGLPLHHAQLSALASILHAAPLDLAVNVWLPLAPRRGVRASAADAVSVVCALELLVFSSGVWRLTRRITGGGDPVTRVLLAAVLCMGGSLEVYAGYAESAGLVLAIAPWWCDALLAPLARPRDAWRLAALWCAMLLAHRLALVLALPMAWRLAMPESSDGRGARLSATVASAGAFLLALAASVSQLARDRGDVAIMWFTAGARPSVSLVFGDAINTLLVVAPAAFAFSGVLADAVSSRTALRDPRVRILCVALLPLAVLLPVLPWGREGLGGQRDWDISVLLGFVLTLVVVSGAAASTSVRVIRRAAVLALPLLTLHAGAWIVLQSSERACLQRADAMLRGVPPLPVPQQVHVASYLGERCRVTGYPEAAAHFYEHAAVINPNPNDALRAADAWLAAGHTDDARRMLDRARGTGRTLDPIASRSAAALDSSLRVISASLHR